jgi:transcriptional regulator
MKSPNQIEVLQTTLGLIILQTLRWGPNHGYGISQLVGVNSGERLKVKAGSLYPALQRLERKGWIQARWTTSEQGQRVREYRLTAAGRKQLSKERSRWEQLSFAMAGILADPERGGA